MAIPMTQEILSLIILTALTVLGFMSAINAHGVTRISLSYLLATFLLAVNVFAIVQYANSEVSRSREAEYATRLEEERRAMQMQLQGNSVDQELLREREIISDEILKVETILNSAGQLAEQIASLNLLDYTLTYEQKQARSARFLRTAREYDANYKSLRQELVHVKIASIDEGFQSLLKAAQYSVLYYRAADSAQEAVREGVMRSSAQAATNSFRQSRQSLNRMKR